MLGENSQRMNVRVARVAKANLTCAAFIESFFLTTTFAKVFLLKPPSQVSNLFWYLRKIQFQFFTNQALRSVSESAIFANEGKTAISSHN